MASKQKTYAQPKLLGQIYTPDFIVRKILDDMFFNSPLALEKHTIDPSCGDGRFLVEVVKRIITWSKPSQLADNLSFVHGWDIDEKAVEDCKRHLNELIAPLDIYVKWNIEVCDALFFYENFNKKFDFIVGNPPYIRIQHLEETQRKSIQTHFSFCKNGSTDIYIAFFQLAHFLLADDGKCGFITPNSYFFTTTASDFRAFFASQQLLLQVSNYGEIQLFDNASTYSAITIFSKQKNDFFSYQKAKDTQTFENRNIPFSEINEVKIWALSPNEQELPTTQKTLLKDLCKIHVGITTLCDKAYIFSIENTDNEDVVIANTKLKGAIKIEKGILKPIIKASTLKNAEQGISDYVLFPYQKENGKQTIIKEAILKEKFPLAYDYLLSVKENLDARDNGKINTVAWYAFGRSQGLETSFGRKILFSPMNLRPKFIDYPIEDCTFYSGYCIKFDGDRVALLAKLNSDAMADFVAVSSRDFRGGWKAYSKKTIEDFPIGE
jgi:type I restriction-modification system DNA methylase subunit